MDNNKLLNNINIILSNNNATEVIFKVDSDVDEDTKQKAVSNFFTNNIDMLKHFSIGLGHALIDKNSFFRGSSTKRDSIVMINPKVRTTDRKTAMRYEVLLDMFKQSNYFKQIPNRLRSFIFTDNYDNAERFGHVNVIIPINNAKIAFTKDDFNYNTLREANSIVNYTINNALDNAIDSILESDNLYYVDIKNDAVRKYNNLISELRNFYILDYLFKNVPDFFEYSNIYEYFEKEYPLYSEFNNIFLKCFLEYFLKLDRNNDLKDNIYQTYEYIGKHCIKLLKYNENFYLDLDEIEANDPVLVYNTSFGTPIDQHEFWTEDKCLVINEAFFEEYILNNTSIKDMILKL